MKEQNIYSFALSFDRILDLDILFLYELITSFIGDPTLITLSDLIPS